MTHVYMSKKVKWSFPVRKFWSARPKKEGGGSCFRGQQSYKKHFFWLFPGFPRLLEIVNVTHSILNFQVITLFSVFYCWSYLVLIDLLSPSAILLRPKLVFLSMKRGAPIAVVDSEKMVKSDFQSSFTKNIVRVVFILVGLVQRLPCILLVEFYPGPRTSDLRGLPISARSPDL